MAREVRQRSRPAPPPTETAARGGPDAAKRSGDYEVGYMKPPKHTQFQPGQSGNPNGRPKGTKNLKTDLAEELQEHIALREGGARRTVSKQRAILKRLMERALQGDTKAASLIINMVARFLDQTEDEQHSTPLAKTDLEILKAYEMRVKAHRKQRSMT